MCSMPRFSEETVVPTEYFEQLLEDLDTDGAIVPTLARAAQRARRTPNA